MKMALRRVLTKQCYDTDSSSNSSKGFPDWECRQTKGTQTDEETWEQKIVEAILNALPLKHQQEDSIISFEDWLKGMGHYGVLLRKVPTLCRTW